MSANNRRVEPLSGSSLRLTNTAGAGYSRLFVKNEILIANQICQTDGQ